MPALNTIGGSHFGADLHVSPFSNGYVGSALPANALEKLSYGYKTGGSNRHVGYRANDLESPMLSAGAAVPHANKEEYVEYLDPYLNLVASHHNAYIVPTEDGKAVLEITAHESSISAGAKQTRSSQPKTSANAKKKMDLPEISSTTMGAITLIAFLNLLGYIQSTLSQSGRRRRRAADEEGFHSELIPVPPVPSFFGEILQGLQFWQEEEEEKMRLLASSRVDPPTRRTISSKESWGSFFSSLGQRFRLAASVMGFLVNPGPSRVRRSLDEAVQKVVRSKRFTSGMNTWYNELAQQYSGDSRSQGLGGGLLSTLMLGLGRQFLGR